MNEKELKIQSEVFKKLKFFKVLTVILILYFFISLFLFFYFIIKNKGKDSQDFRKNSSQESEQSDILSNDPKKYIIKDSEILEVKNSEKKVLFTNAENVEEVKLGPDDKTLHFKTKENRQYGNCVILTDRVSPDPYPINSLERTPAPINPPWDYQRLGEAYTIKTCENSGKTGGYLKNSDYFVYMQKEPDMQLTLYIIGKNKQEKIKLDSNILGNTGNLVDEFINSDSSYVYYYPQIDAKLNDNVIIFAIGRLVLAVDVGKNKLLGSLLLNEPEYNISGNSFWFKTSENSSVVLVESGWEGFLRFEALIDVGQSRFITIPLYPHDKGVISFQIQRAVWEDENKVLFNFYKPINISDEAGWSKIDNLADIDLEELEEQLEATGNYLEVDCRLIGEDGCFAITNKNVDKYEYTQKNGLTKL
jgi:hypothetical protein